MNQMLSVRLLEKRGHSVQVAENGKKVLEILDQAPPDEFALILMDVQMPEMDGFEVTAVIRDREKQTGRHIPIVAMTAHAMKGDRERCLAAGMDDYVAKPVRGKELHAVLDKLLHGAPRPAGSPAPQPAAAPPEPAEEAAPDDADILSRVNGDKALLKELRTLFLAENPKLMTQLREAINSRSAEPVRKAAHTLKGMLPRECRSARDRDRNHSRQLQVLDARHLAEYVSSALVTFPASHRPQRRVVQLQRLDLAARRFLMPRDGSGRAGMRRTKTATIWNTGSRSAA